MKKAVFLDRDGVINKEIGEYVFQQEKFAFNPGIFENLKLLHDNGFLLIVISNQGGISKGIYTIEQVEILHQYLKDEMLKKNVVIDDVYYCPHHDEIENCLCRKPKPLLIKKAIAYYNINPVNSFFIGDSERDIIAAENAGLKRNYLINPNQNIKDICQVIINNH